MSRKGELPAKVDPNHKDLNADADDDDETAEKNLSTGSAKGTNTVKDGATSSSARPPPPSTHTDEILRPLLLQDTTANASPPHLLELFKHFDLNSCTEVEILFQLIYLAALETGFAEQHAYEQCMEELHTSCTTSSIFDARNVRILAKKKPSFSFDNNHRKFHMNLVSVIANNDRIFRLSSIVTGDLMIVTLTPVSKESPLDVYHQAFSLCLDIPRYIVNNAWKEANFNRNHYHLLNKSFGQLQVLSNNLRQQLFVPSQIDHLIAMDIPLYPALLGLPDELYDYIFHCLSRNNLRILANVCKRLHYLVSNSKHYQRAVTRSNRI